MRRITVSTLFMTAAFVLAVSCNKPDEREGCGRTVINGVAEAIGTGTKADMAYCYEVIWRENDQIYVTDGTKDDTFTLSGGFDTNRGQFTEDNDKGITGDIEAFYPASLKTDDGYVWPATQTNNPVAPMYARQTISGTEAETVSFSSLGAMLQIVFSTTVKGITLTSITLEHNKKPLSGTFTVDKNGQAIMSNNDANPGVTLNLGESGVPVGVAATYFHLAIPAGSYSTPEKDEVMTITFKDDVHGKWCALTSTSFPEVRRNTVGRITLAGNDFQNMQFTVKFDMNNTGLTGNFTTAPDVLNVEANKTIKTAERPFAENYGFLGWYKDANCTNAWDFANDKVNGNIVLYAKWVKDPAEDNINGHEYVKLAGSYWGTKNAVGSHPTTKDEIYGYYYTQSKYYALEVAQSWGHEDNYTWTLPDEAQWQALSKYCDWEWKDNYNNTGMNGCLVKGRAGFFESENCIFLPAAGFCDSGKTSANGQGSGGFYWSIDSEICLFFTSDRRLVDHRNSDYSFAVRPIAGFTK